VTHIIICHVTNLHVYHVFTNEGHVSNAK